MFAATAAFAQLEPVKWSYDYTKINEKEYEIVFTANIQDGWSIYSSKMQEGGPIPTKIAYQNTVQTVGETTELGKKEEIYDNGYGMNLIKMKGNSKIKQRVKIADGSMKIIAGHITYMSCNDRGCIPPKDVNFQIALKD